VRERHADFVDGLAADITGQKLERVLELLGHGLQHLDCLRDDLPTYAITG
jgi:hypothetical protein